MWRGGDDAGVIRWCREGFLDGGIHYGNNARPLWDRNMI